MIHYYAGLAALAPPALVATALTGALHDGSQRHLALGLFAAIYCVAVHTLFILFMIVTGRVLRAAMATRPLGAEFLGELNEFFARKRAYPAALVAALLVVAASVLGHGALIGVPGWVHWTTGLAALLVNTLAVGEGVRTLRANQGLVDRVAGELDRLDAERSGEPEPAPEQVWTVGPAGRWLAFALSAWLPYLYWGLVVWRGDFGRIHPALPFVCGLASAFGFLRAWGAGRSDG